MTAITPGNFAFVQELVGRRSGIVLGPEKGYLVETRLTPLARDQSLADINVLVDAARRGDASLCTLIVEAMTTNETLFFRDRLPFEHLQNIILPTLMQRRADRRRLRIWCAACSTGQEPYSIAMLLDEMRPQLRGLDVEIIATDLSEKVLTQAREAAYSQFEVQRGLPIKKLLAHFTQVGTRWVLSRAIADSVRFSQCNLLEDFTRLGTFDVILCRNVLIYFDALTKVRVLRNLAAQLAPDGYLLLGGAETVLGITPLLVPHRTERGLYVRAGSPDAAATIQFPRLASAGA